MSFFNVNGVVVSEDCELVVGENKKMVGKKSWLRYEEYKNSKSVKEYLENGGKREDLRYDCGKGFVKLLSYYDLKSKKIVKVK